MPDEITERSSVDGDYDKRQDYDSQDYVGYQDSKIEGPHQPLAREFRLAMIVMIGDL